MDQNVIAVLKVLRWFWTIPFTLFLGAVTLMLLPNSLIGNIKPLKKVKAKVLKWKKRAVELSLQGPFFRLTVWSGKKGACGRLASTPRAPKNVKVKSHSTTESFIWWTPDFPWNPFHEEDYICSWRLADDADAKWRVKQMMPGDYEVLNNRRKATVDALPQNTRCLFRVCAVNRKGRGPWSAEVESKSFAEPNREGGYHGPLGPAASKFPEDKRQYRWTQQRGDIVVKMPILEEWKSSDIRFNKTPTKFELVYVGPEGDQKEVILGGTFPYRAKIDEMFWQIDTTKEEGRHITITMTKEDPLKQWPCVIEGNEHPCIDVKFVRLLTDGMDDNIDWLKENNPR